MTSPPSADKILAKAMMYLMQTAANDGVITEEEAELINSFEISLRKYERALNRAYEDGIITSEEELQLDRLKDLIVQSGRSVADLEDGISKDEMNLLISMMLSLEVPKSSPKEL